MTASEFVETRSRRDARPREVTVSVVVPAHDYGRYLGQAIDSLRRQVDVDWECVVVDDGSTDDTAEVVAALAAADSRITYLSQAASGPSAARNAGLAVASGEFVQFVDADDYLGPRKLAHQLEVFGQHPQADIVYGGVRYFADDDLDDAARPADFSRLEASTARAVSGAGESILAALVDDNFMVVESPLIRRSLLQRVAGFDPRIRRMEDWELWLQFALSGAFFQFDGAVEDDSLPHVRVHRSSSSQDQVAMHRAAVRVRARVENQLPTPELRRLNRKRIHEHLAVIGMLEGFGGHLAYGMRYLLKAGFAERRLKWLAWAVAMPAARVPLGRRAIDRLRGFFARRRGEEVREWHAEWR